jgi:hypothetical protein
MLHHSFQVAVSGRDQPHVNPVCAATAKSLEFLFLQNA